MQDLTDKVAVVTGAGSGIGRALALALAAEGATVVAADLEADAAAETAALVAAAGGRAETRTVDVADGDAVDALADAVFAAHGHVDVLANNAGVFVGGTIWERPAADLEFVLGVNLWGILHGIRAFVPRMVAQGTEGHVVNTASVAGLFTTPFSGPYSISKFAAFAASEALANDLAATGSQIKASVLCPGMVRTGIAEGSERHRPADLGTPFTDDQAMVQGFLADAVARGMDPAEVAALVLDAIRAERFLVLTSDAYEAFLHQRADELAARQLPAWREYV